MNVYQMVKVDDRVYPGGDVQSVWYKGDPRHYIITMKDGRTIETTHPVTVVYNPQPQNSGSAINSPFNASTYGSR